MNALFTATMLTLGMATTALGQDAYPLTIEHAFGETEIAGKPERIVTLSWMSQEAIIALGETPVAIQFQGWGGNEEGYLPWIVEALETRGKDLPPTIDTTDGIPFEEVLGYEPDLIFAPYSGFSSEDYERLSQIAPTVPYAEAPWTGAWQDVVRSAGRVLDMQDQAEALVGRTQDQLAAYGESYPVISGKTFVFGGGGMSDGNLNVYIPSDPRVGLFRDLGMTPAEGLYDLPTDTFNQAVSVEQLDLLQADIFVSWYSDQAEVDDLLANPLFSRWSPIAEGHYVPVVDRSAGMALSAPSPLSIPWVMDRFVPMMAEALE